MTHAHLGDRRVVACNYAEQLPYIPEGSLCYVLNFNRGNGSDRICLLARSRSGRWIKKWESVEVLTNFRIKSIPPEHPRYDDLEHAADPQHLEEFMEATKAVRW